MKLFTYLENTIKSWFQRRQGQTSLHFPFLFHWSKCSNCSRTCYIFYIESLGQITSYNVSWTWLHGHHAFTFFSNKYEKRYFVRLNTFSKYDHYWSCPRTSTLPKWPWILQLYIETLIDIIILHFIFQYVRE